MKGPIDMEERVLRDVSTMRPLASYDDKAAHEVEVLSKKSEELLRETEVLRAELERLNRQLEAGDGKSRIKTLQAEQTHYEEQTDRVSMEMLRLKAEVSSINLDIEPERIDLEFDRINGEIQFLKGQRDEISSSIPFVEAEIASLQREITAGESRLKDEFKTLADLTEQSRRISSRIAALKGLQEAFLRQKDLAAKDDPYKEKIIKVSEALKNNNSGALRDAAALALELDAALGDLSKDAREILGALSAKYKILEELHEKEPLAPSMRSEIESLSKALRDKSESLEKIKLLNADDKVKAGEMEKELTELRDKVRVVSEEVSRARLLTSGKDVAERDFISLFEQNADMLETLQSAAKKMQEISTTARKGL